MSSVSPGSRCTSARMVAALVWLLLAACGSQRVGDYCDKLASCEQIESNGYASSEACVDENQETVDCLNSSGRSQACAGAFESYLGCKAEVACAELAQSTQAQCESAAAAFSDSCQSIPLRCSFHERSTR